jgi:hypothetical protein
MLAHFAAEGLESILQFDARALVSLRALVRPGALTADFARGRRKPFVAPLQLFLICNLVFFIIEPLTGLTILAPPFDSQLHQSLYGGLTSSAAARYAAVHGPVTDEFRARFFRLTTLQARSLVILMVPMFAALMILVRAGGRRLFLERVVFALHLYGFWLLWLSIALIVTGLLILIVPGPLRGRFDTPLTVVEFLGVFVYLGFGLQTAYGERGPQAWTKAALLTLGSYYVMHVYRFILFFTTLYWA